VVRIAGARKTVLGLRQGTTEIATALGELPGDLAERGLAFSQPRADRGALVSRPGPRATGDTYRRR
jgi:hypothetical protein